MPLKANLAEKTNVGENWPFERSALGREVLTANCSLFTSPVFANCNNIFHINFLPVKRANQQRKREREREMS